MGFFSKISKVVTHVHSAGSIVINGKTYKNISGNIVVNDEGVFVNGQPLEEYKEHVVMNVTIQGDCDTVEAEDGDISIVGNVRDVTAKNGNIRIDGSVTGNVDNKNGNVAIHGSVGGDVTTKNGNITRL